MNVLSDITVSARFKKVYYTARYSYRDKSGHETGIVTHRNVEYGSVVKSPNYQEVVSSGSIKYYFCGWSDGVKTLTRTDEVTDNFEVFACFGVKVTYAVFDGTGGRIDGETEQIFYFEEDCTDVTAVAIGGYVFGGWSDLSMEETRHSDGAVTSDRTYVAYFEPFEKSFNLDYGDLYNAPQKTTVTLNRREVINTFLPVLKVDGYDFCGWYIDEDFSLKFADADGRVMLGYYTFLLETDSLYAKFKAKNDDTVTYKTLFVMTDEIHALLSPSANAEAIAVDYKMTTIERLILGLVPIKFSSLLNEWFDGKILFEADAYFTLIPIGTEQSRAGEEAFNGSSLGDWYVYQVATWRQEEVGLLNGQYHSIINSYGMNDYDYKLHATTGLATEKYATIHLEGQFINFYNGIISKLTRKLLFDGFNEDVTECLYTYVHEFTHTIEMYYDYGEIYDYHKAVGSGNVKEGLDRTKLYLLGQFEYNGEYVGIPESFWHHDIYIKASYSITVINDTTSGFGGTIYFLDEYGNRIKPPRIKYGRNRIAEAVPFDGYRFVKWSDGVKTPIRYDNNIISYIAVQAIFEPIA